MNTDKKYGRRKSGAYGRCGSMALKRAANKASRKQAKEQTNVPRY